MIKLVVFDLWNTLAYKDVEVHPLDIIREKLKVKNPREEFIKIFEESTQTKKWKTKKEAYANLCKNLKIPETEENIKIIRDIRDKAEKKIKLFEYTEDLIQQLKKQSYEIGIASNSTIFIIEEIKKNTNLLEKIDYPLFSFDVGVIKPDSKIFHKIIELSGYKPDEIVMIGDNYYDDVLPPRELGMYSIHLKNYEQLKQELALIGVFLD